VRSEVSQDGRIHLDTRFILESDPAPQGGTFLEQGNAAETTLCHPVTEALSRAGDKWTIQIVMQLEGGPKRFSELRRNVGGISQKMLASTLRGLERDGFVARTVYPTKPPSVEYTLTDLGQEMVVPVRALGQWVIDNLHRIELARSDFGSKGRTD
jgi:DNA-binding HxlR family transcriptional regulator